MPPDHDFRAIEKKVTDLSDALAHISTADDFRHLIQILNGRAGPLPPS